VKLLSYCVFFLFPKQSEIRIFRCIVYGTLSPLDTYTKTYIRKANCPCVLHENVWESRRVPPLILRFEASYTAGYIPAGTAVPLLREQEGRAGGSQSQFGCLEEDINLLPMQDIAQRSLTHSTNIPVTMPNASVPFRAYHTENRIRIHYMDQSVREKP
jgi:hypothetical protein